MNPHAVARQLIAFGRLKHARGPGASCPPWPGRKTTNRLRAIETCCSSSRHCCRWLCRKTTNRLRAIETRPLPPGGYNFRGRRKTTNRLRAIETTPLVDACAPAVMVARQLIAFGRLKPTAPAANAMLRMEVARQLIAFGRLKPIHLGQVVLEHRRVARQLIAFGRLKLEHRRFCLGPMGGRRKTTNRLRAIETQPSIWTYGRFISSQDN